MLPISRCPSRGAGVVAAPCTESLAGFQRFEFRLQLKAQAGNGEWQVVFRTRRTEMELAETPIPPFRPPYTETL